MSGEINASSVIENATRVVGQDSRNEEPQVESPQGEIAEQSPSVETTTEVEIPKTDESKEKEFDYARTWNALTRRERQLQERESSIKEQFNQVKEFQESMQSLKENPIAFMEKHGWTANQLADFMLNDQKPTESSKIEQLMSRIDELETERKKEKETREQQAEREKQEKIVNNFKNQIKDHVSSDSDSYELINHFGEYDTVYDVIEEEYNKSGNILDVATASKWVEKYLEDQMEKAASTNKFKKRYNLQQESQKQEMGRGETETFADAVRRNEPTRTLTNAEVASAPPVDDGRWLSDEESKQRAADMLRQAWMKKEGYTRN